jgi:hypothetical protein
MIRIRRRPLLAMLPFGAAARRLAAAAQPAPARWLDWQTIIYQRQNGAQLAALKRLGVTAGKLFASRDDKAGDPANPEAARFARYGMRFYVENIATDFYSAYHRWRPDRPVNAAFLAVQALHRRAPDDLAAFIRKPGLSDPVWLRRIAARLARTVHDYAPFRPLYYSLADEPGIADLAANWDFDLSPDALAAMRVWLRGEYDSLAALNRQWGTRFPHWADVMPRLTDEAVRQRGENFSAWADFKRWMDVAFARAVQTGTKAVHDADPRALAAIEGAQIPGWGGYNYTRLASAVDVMEIYDEGENIEIARSLNPALVMLVTLGNGGDRQMHKLWRSLLRGMRGAILWDEHGALVGEDGTVGSWGERAGPVFAELRGPLGRLLLQSRRLTDPVATLYTPASLRTQWILDRRAGGGPWENRSAETEDEDDDAIRTAMRRFARLVTQAGLQGSYTAPRLVERGALRNGQIRLLLLPQVIALSAGAAAEIRRFTAQGGVVAADVIPGQFDEHSRRLPSPLLRDLFQPGAAGKGAALLVPLPPGGQPAADAAAVFARAGVRPAFRFDKPMPDVAIFRFRHGTTTILALHRDFAPGAAVPVTLHLPAPAFVYDLRARRELGRMTHLPVSLDPVTPTLLAVSATRPFNLPGFPA